MEERFTSLSIKGFRRLREIENLELRPLCVMIGANGVGKTSVLDAFALLANSADGKLSPSMSAIGGLTNVLSYDGASDLELGIDMSVEGQQPLRYQLQLRPEGIAYKIDNESLAQRRKPLDPPFLYIISQSGSTRYFSGELRTLVRPIWEYKPLETSLSQVPKLFREPERFRSRLASSNFYSVLNVSQRSPIRLPQPMQPASLPGHEGEELVSCLFNLRETERDRFEAIEDALRAAFPKFERLDFPPVAAGVLALAWREKGFSRPMYMHQLSEGTLRFLWLATLLQSPGLTALTLLDEPEVSLHPELLRLLAGLLREASRRTQIVVATHSDRLVRFLNPREVLTMDIGETGNTEVSWADQKDLDAWLAEYTLDELWANGRLGARA